MADSQLYFDEHNNDHRRSLEPSVETTEILPIIHDSNQTSLQDVIYKKRPIGLTTRGKIIVENLVFNTYIYIHYDNTRLLSAKRTLCGFNIYSTKDNKFVAHLRANIFGTKYCLDPALEIKYETSFLQRGKPRSFMIKLDSLSLCNKKPYFNNDTNSFSLNFSGRITRPSVKNFQIIHPLDPTYITLTFGKEDINTYILDFTYPWSAINAFCVGLTALDHKFGCDWT
jgi:Tub family